jgi:hypothetical protein
MSGHKSDAFYCWPPSVRIAGRAGALAQSIHTIIGAVKVNYATVATWCQLTKWITDLGRCVTVTYGANYVIGANEQISRNCEFKRNNSELDGSTKGRGDHGSLEDKRSSEECVHCVSQN